LSFKNRILLSTLVVVVGGIVAIAAILELAVFPELQGDDAAIFNLKVIHFVASFAVIALSWIFIEIISKRITAPLRELTRHADQISRDAGKRIDAAALTRRAPGPDTARFEPLHPADEIEQLTISFHRMLYHLKVSEDCLRESEEKYRTLFDNAPSPIFVLHAEDFTILDANATAEEDYGQAHHRLVGLRFPELAPTDARFEAEHMLRKLTSGGGAVLPPLRQVRPDGSTFLINVQTHHLSRFGDVPSIVVAVWDVTEKLEQEAKIVQTGKMATLGEMATGIAHELNQPLNVIRIASDLLFKSVRRGAPLAADRLQTVAEELESNVARASRIISHLQQFGRKAEDTMRPISVSEPIRGVFTLLGAQLRKRDITFDVDAPGDLPLIQGDANRLEQVLVNLVINARDAMLDPQAPPNPKRLTVRAYQEDDRLIVSVADTGRGVPGGLRAKIFEPFFTTKGTAEGTGLGLSISYGIVKEHGGVIEIDEHAAEGTTFKLSFPALIESTEDAHEDSGG
jgi:PAS domain S-box-containing protein